MHDAECLNGGLLLGASGGIGMSSEISTGVLAKEFTE